MTQNDTDYVIHVHESEDPPAIVYGMFTLGVIWVVGVVYAIMF